MLADRSRLQGKGFLSLCIVKMCSSVLSILFWKTELSFLFFRAVKQMVSYKYGTYKLATLSAKSTWIVRYMYKFTLILVLEYLPFAVIYIACTVEWSTSKTMFILLILLCIIDQLKWLLSENHSTAWSVSISSSWYWNKLFMLVMRTCKMTSNWCILPKLCNLFVECVGLNPERRICIVLCPQVLRMFLYLMLRKPQRQCF